MNGPARRGRNGRAIRTLRGLPTRQPGEESPESSLAELEDRWLRARADLDNLRKRHAAELRREREAERARVAATLLPVLDNLELALAHAEADPGAIVQGVLATRDQAVQALAAAGVSARRRNRHPVRPQPARGRRGHRG